MNWKLKRRNLDDQIMIRVTSCLNLSHMTVNWQNRRTEHVVLCHFFTILCIFNGQDASLMMKTIVGCSPTPAYCALIVSIIQSGTTARPRCRLPVVCVWDKLPKALPASRKASHREQPRWKGKSKQKKTISDGPSIRWAFTGLRRVSVKALYIGSGFKPGL